MVCSACPGRRALCPIVVTAGLTYWGAKKLLWRLSKKLTVHLGLHQWCPRERQIACWVEAPGVNTAKITPVFWLKLPSKRHASAWLGLLAAPWRLRTTPSPPGSYLLSGWDAQLVRCYNPEKTVLCWHRCCLSSSWICEHKSMALSFCPKRL